MRALPSLTRCWILGLACLSLGYVQAFNHGRLRRGIGATPATDNTTEAQPSATQPVTSPTTAPVITSATSPPAPPPTTASVITTPTTALTTRDTSERILPDIQYLDLTVTCRQFGPEPVKRSSAQNSFYTYLYTEKGTMPSAAWEKVTIFATVANQFFKVVFAEKVGENEYKIKHAIPKRTTSTGNQTLIFPSLAIPRGWYMGFSTSDTLQTLPIQYNVSANNTQTGVFVERSANKDSVLTMQPTNKVFSFSIELCPYKRPEIRNPDQCQYIGNDLTPRRYTRLDNLEGERYLNTFSAEEMRIPVKQQYVHSLFAFIQDDNTTADLYLYEKINDDRLTDYTVKHVQKIDPTYYGIAQFPILRDIHELADLRQCSQDSNSESCTIRLGIGSNQLNAPIGFDDDIYSQIFELITEDQKAASIGDVIKFGNSPGRKKFSMGVVVCDGDAPDEIEIVVTPPNSRGGRESIDGSSALSTEVIIAISVTAGVILLTAILGFIGYQCYKKKLEAAKRHHGATSMSTLDRTDAINTPDFSTMATEARQKEFYSNPNILKRSMSRYTGAMVSSAVQTLDKERPPKPQPTVDPHAYKALPPEPDEMDSELSPQAQYVPMENNENPKLQVLEIPPEEISYISGLKGSLGNFADIYVADWKWKKITERVIVKRLKGDATDEDASLMQEKARLMCGLFPHPYIISTIGTVMYKDDVALVLEYYPEGTLKSFLMRNRTQKKLSNRLKSHMCRFTYEIAEAMAFLHRNDILHRRLWTRNVLVSKTLTCKLHGFDPRRDDLFRAELPQYERWLAPELTRDKPYTAASDVWAFGVTVWEIFSFGALPYKGQKSDFQIQQAIAEGYQLPMPQHCSLAFYEDIMQPCWNLRPQERPSFVKLATSLSKHGRLSDKGGTTNSSHTYMSVRTDDGEYMRPIPLEQVKNKAQKSNGNLKGLFSKATPRLELNDEELGITQPSADDESNPGYTEIPSPMTSSLLPGGGGANMSEAQAPLMSDASGGSSYMPGIVPPPAPAMSSGNSSSNHDVVISSGFDAPNYN